METERGEKKQKRRMGKDQKKKRGRFAGHA
jgi:hypothetical protein